MKIKMYSNYIVTSKLTPEQTDIAYSFYLDVDHKDTTSIIMGKRTRLYKFIRFMSMKEAVELGPNIIFK